MMDNTNNKIILTLQVLILYLILVCLTKFVLLSFTPYKKAFYLYL